MSDHPDDAQAASLLGVLAMSRIRPPHQEEITQAVLAARAAGVAAPALMRACTELALEAHQEGVARQCAETDLAQGEDSSWQLLRLARLDFRASDTAQGTTRFIEAVASVRDPAELEELSWHLQWFLWPEELREFRGLPRKERAAWMSARLAARDIRDGQPRGARLAEHFRRLEFVLEHFWTRPSEAAFLQRRLLLGITGLANLSSAGGQAADPGGASPNGGSYRRWQTAFDDRGVVYMRLGAPTERYYWGYSFARELWIYEIDGQRLMFNFQDEDNNGSTEATRLVLGVNSFFFCGIDPTRCELGMSTSRGSEYYSNLRAGIVQEDRRAQVVGTTMDDNSVRGGQPIRMAAHYYRLWDPTDGRPVALISYVVRAEDLHRQVGDGIQSAEIQLGLREWDGDGGVERDTAFNRSVVFHQMVGSLTQLTGLVGRHEPPTTDSWSLIVTQADGRRGRAWEGERGVVDTGTFRMSDLILGSADQQTRWQAGATTVTLAPLGNFDRTRAVSLYFQQLNGDRETTVQRTITLKRLDQPSKNGEPDLQVVSSGPVASGLSEVGQELDVSNLAAGYYRLDVVLEDTRHHRTVRRSASLILR